MSDIGDRFNEIMEGIKDKKNKAESQTDGSSDVHSNVNNDGNINNNSYGNDAIVISKKQNSDRVKRTYYISSDHDEEITTISKKTGRDKSEIVRLALDYFFENLEVK